MRKASVGAAIFAIFAVGCSASADGGSTPAPKEPQAPPPANEAPPPPKPNDTPPGPDHGAPSTTYPAFKPEIARIVNQGGAVLKTPLIVTITWPGEPNADAFEKMGDVIGGTDYWAMVTGEYGVGKASSSAASHVRMPQALGDVIKSDDVDALVPTNVKSGAWPAPTDQTIYTIYLPTTTKVDMGDGGYACDEGVGGYHDSVDVNGKQVSYAIIFQCADLDDATVSASHEWAEASLDPIPEASAGWQGLDGDHFAWDLMQRMQDENGDMCEMYDDFLVRNTSPALPWAVQRQWSNKSALAGHDPCVPAAADKAYFSTTPLVTEDIALDLTSVQGPSDQKTKGVKLAVGESRTIPIGFFSDAQSDAWTVDAFELDPFDDKAKGPFDPMKTPNVELSFDKTSGTNGEKALLTVKLNTAPAVKASLVLLVSSQGNTKHYMPLLVGGK
jgi:hypothetical protein